MENLREGENLPGYKKKSFVLPYNGGEIWVEHLDGIYDYEELVINKLTKDIPVFSRPSSPSFVCFVFDETRITDKIITALNEAILNNKKRYMKIAFVGLDKKSVRKINKELSGKGFGICFFNGIEDAKEWLLIE